MDFGWDDLKEAEVRAERGHGFTTPCQIFLGRVVEQFDYAHGDDDEERMIAIGRAAGVVWTVIYEDRIDIDGPIRWIITAWPADREERELWHAGA